MKLDVGCGTLRHGEDYTTVDLYNPKADIKATMWDLPFPDNSVEAIWAEACLEHIARPKVQPTLKEWLRVLQPCGTVVISVPDLDWVCRYWLEKPAYGAHAFIFGNQTDEGDFHRCGWNVDFLYQDLKEAGLYTVSIERGTSHGQEMLRATCIKPAEGAQLYWVLDETVNTGGQASG